MVILGRLGAVNTKLFTPDTNPVSVVYVMANSYLRPYSISTLSKSVDNLGGLVSERLILK